jgi:tRNA/rRNA methyltransferase
MTEISVVLVEPMYEGNMGSVARLIKNFGLRELILVNPPRHPKESPDARSMAMHGLDVLESAKIIKDYNQLTGLFDFLIGTTAISATDSNSRRRPIFPEELVKSLARDGEGRIAIIFGREDRGMSNEEIDACDIMVTIPASREYPTMNLSHSVAVILYELSKRKFSDELGAKKKFHKIGGLEKKILQDKFDEFVEVIQDHDFEKKLAKKTFKQVIGRAFIAQKEAFTLTGIFRRGARFAKKGKYGKTDKD